jgi:sugar fermentation stimulation protein A
MRFDPPLIPGRLERRYKRFLADVEIEGRIETVHCPNPGSMLGLAEPGSRVWVSRSANPARKLPLTWELVEVPGSLVGINTAFANALVGEALEKRRIPEVAGYGEIRREVAYGERSRIDFLLAGTGRAPCYVEVKSVTLARRPPVAEFPDSVTARGARHLAELEARSRENERAVMLFLAQRADCDCLTIAGDIDPAYARAWAGASLAGVEALAYACSISPHGIEIDRPIAFQPALQP